MRCSLVTWSALASLPTVALAHPHHGVLPSTSLWHYVAEPAHLLWAAAALSSVLAWRSVRRRRAGTQRHG